VRLLTHLRFAGHVFNPVSFYYCYQADGSTLDCIVAEITNTPGRNGTPMCCRSPRPPRRGVIALAVRQALPCLAVHADGLPLRLALQPPDEDLRVHMQVWRDGVRQFDATQAMQRHAWMAAGWPGSWPAIH
jgi:DUF1365 family protein